MSVLPRCPSFHVHKWPLFHSIERILLFEHKLNSFLPLIRTVLNIDISPYCWFSHDVTKIQTTKLSILPRFYFHDALEQLKTNFHTNFRFKRVLGFVIEYAWISKLLRDAAFTWRPRELSFRLKKWLFSRNFCYLNSSSIRKSVTLMFMSSSRSKFTLLYCKTR